MRNLNVNKGFWIRLSLVVLLTSLVACDLIPSKPQKVVFLDNSYSIMMPSSWSLRNDLNDAADLQMGNNYKEAYVIIISENKMDFENLSLEGHSDLTRSLLKESLGNYQESDPEYLTSGKFRALRYRMTGSIEGLNLVYWHVTLESSKHYHQIVLWSIKAKFSGNEADYENVIQSFAAITE